MGKRILLFVLTNLAVIATISIVFSVFGISPYLNQYGINYQSLAIFCLLWGGIGSFISLLFSKKMAKMAMGVKIVDQASGAVNEAQLVAKVHSLAQRAGLRTMPEVGIYESPQPNAFATGPSRNNALVAVSTGLLANFSEIEVEGVLAHEVTHITNGDMITMTLIQGVVNAFAMFLSRIIAYAISVALQSDEDSPISFMTFYLLSIVFDILFTLLGSIVVAAFSRWREFRADAGGAAMAGKSNMIAALERLQAGSGIVDNHGQSLNALKIADKPKLIGLLATHPSLELRILRLQQSG